MSVVVSEGSERPRDSSSPPPCSVHEGPWHGQTLEVLPHLLLVPGEANQGRTPTGSPHTVPVLKPGCRQPSPRILGALAQSEPQLGSLREGAGPLGVSNIEAVNPTDQMLLALVQGLTWEKDLPIRWIPDVVLSLRRHGDELDWARFLDLAARIGVSTHVGRGLAYLDATFDDVPIPLHVRPALRRRARPLSERAELWFRLRKGPQYPWGGLPATWFQYQHRMRAAGQRPTVVGFARNKKQFWQDLEGLTVPRALLGRTRRWVQGVARSLRTSRRRAGNPHQ